MQKQGYPQVDFLLKNDDVRLGTRSVNMNTLKNHDQSIPPKKRVY